MSDHRTSSVSSKIFPTLRYQDAPAAIDWLVKAFGMDKQLVIPNSDGTIAHAQLKFGSDVIMLGSSKQDALGLKSPRELGGVTQSLYIYLKDVDAHYDRAKAACARLWLSFETPSTAHANIAPAILKDISGTSVRTCPKGEGPLVRLQSLPRSDRVSRFFSTTHDTAKKVAGQRRLLEDL